MSSFYIYLFVSFQKFLQSEDLISPFDLCSLYVFLKGVLQLRIYAGETMQAYAPVYNTKEESSSYYNSFGNLDTIIKMLSVLIIRCPLVRIV